MTAENARDLLWGLLRVRGSSAAFVSDGQEFTAADLVARAERWRDDLARQGVRPGTVCAFGDEYSIESCSLMLALVWLGAVLVPFTRANLHERDRLLRLASAGLAIWLAEGPECRIERREKIEAPELLERFRTLGHPGLIVFSSGSTGEPKAILHDLEKVLRRHSPRPAGGYRTLLFLAMDHFGGLNTLFGTLMSGGIAVAPSSRGPHQIAELIEAAHVELLPVTPTFLNLLLASGAHRMHDLTSVKLVTYGAEVMPEATLQRLRGAFPAARLQQTYGLSETGVLRSRSRDSGSLWVRVGGEGFETKVVDGTLRVRSDYAMVGYLNAPSPFDAEGWLDTGDTVVQDGEWLRILGRASDLINVGGQKVFPAEVEGVLLEADDVVDATVTGEKNPLTGSMVVATVVLAGNEDPVSLRQRLRAHCLARLAPYKVPVRFVIERDVAHSDRFKKARRRES